MAINEHLNSVQLSLVAVKGQYNEFAKFNYRSCEDILHAVKPLLGKATLTLSDDIVLVGDRVYVKAVATLSLDGESTSVSAFAREATVKKGMDESQITGSASSYARKYALGGLFAIDNTADADTRDNSTTITDEQVRKITAALKDAQYPVEGFLEKAKIKSIDKMTADRFDAAMTHIENVKESANAT